MIAAVVVTYNRLKYLKKCIDALCHQSRSLDAIYVINNGSTDGTEEWLSSQQNLKVINQSNVGGSGGFHKGLKIAYNDGFDLIWAMDDDVNPTNRCLEVLIKYYKNGIGILCPQRIMDGKIVIDETLKFNLRNPFKSLKRVLRLEDIQNKEIIPIEGMAFEGPLISKDVIAKIGLPNKDLFIFWDDSDFSYRATLAGFKVIYVVPAKLNKENLSVSDIQNIPLKRSWKMPYGLRNLIYFTHKYGRTKIFRLLFPRLMLFQYTLGWIKHIISCDKYYEFNDINVIYIVYRKALKGNLGRISL